MLIDIWAGLKPGWFDEGWRQEEWELIEPDEEKIVQRRRLKSFRTRKIDEN